MAIPTLGPRRLHALPLPTARQGMPSFAARLTAAGRAAAMPVDKGRRLGRVDMLLQALLQDFALAYRLAKGLEPMTALLETRDLAVGEHRASVADDPKLEL